MDWRGIFKNSAVMLAIASFLVYLFSYLFGLGYNQFFKLPGELVSFSIPSLFSTMLALLIGLVVVQVALTFVPAGRHFTQNSPLDNLRRNGSLLIPLFLGLFSLRADWSLIWCVALVPVVFLAFHLVVMPYSRLYRRQGLRRYRDRLIAHWGTLAGGGPKTDDLYLVLMTLPFKAWFTWVALGLASLTISYQIGFYTASTQEMYYRSDSAPNWIIAKLVDDKVVLCKISGKRLTGEFRVVDTTSDTYQSTIYKLVKVGPLQRS